MADQSKVPKVWDLLSQFKEVCRGKGWKTSAHKDVVRVGDEYHSFIGTKTAHPSTFRRITSNKKLAIPEGKSYQIIDVSYIAWVFQQQPSQQLVETLAMSSDLCKKTALYDLSSMYEGKPFCLKLNETGSLAFEEFEKFLKDTYGVETKPLYKPKISEPKTFKSKLLKASTG